MTLGCNHRRICYEEQVLVRKVQNYRTPRRCGDSSRLSMWDEEVGEDADEDGDEYSSSTSRIPLDLLLLLREFR